MRRPVLAAVLIAVATLLFAPAAFAQDEGEKADLALRELGLNPDSLKVPKLSKDQTNYAKAIGQELVCLCGTCPRRTVTSCECGWAQQNQRGIEAALLAGNTKEKIIAAYEKVYGLKVRPTPPKDGIGQLSYMLPYAAILVGLGMIFVIGVRMRNRNETLGATGAGTVEPKDLDRVGGTERSILEKELDELDR